MPSRIKDCFNSLASDSRAALVTYITAGDPDAAATLAYMKALTDNGADIIELGVPFSDPMADGPVIQRASERALEAGMQLQGVIDIVKKFRATDDATPVVLMGYLNPIEAMGYERFARAASDAGVDGVLIVDMPPEEADELNRRLNEQNLDQIFLVSPNSDDLRISHVAELGSGFVYYVTVKGVTGSATLDVEQVATRIKGFRAAVNIPIGVGFGIKTAESAAQVSSISDAVIVGSSLVEIVEACAGDMATGGRQLGEKVAEFRAAMDAALRT